MDSRGGGAVVIKFLTREQSIQRHLCALWEGEVIEEAGGESCLVESEFLQGGEANPSSGRRDGRLGHIGEANLDQFEQGASLEERS